MSYRDDMARCEMAASLSHNLFLKWLLFCKTVACLPALLLPLILVKTKGTKWLLHPNAKVIFLFHVFWMFEVPFTYFFVYLYDFVRLSITHEDACDYLVPTVFSLNFRILPIVGIPGELMTSSAFCIERIVATVLPLRYEKIDKPRFGIIMGLVSSSVAVIFTYLLLFVGVDWNTNLTSFTARTPHNSNRYQAFTGALLFMELLNILLFSVTLVHNNVQHRRFVKHKNVQLANKYQVAENRNLIRILLPVSLIHALVFLYNSTGFCLYPKFYPEWHPVSHTIWLEIFGVTWLYSILMPITLYSILRGKRTSVVNCLQSQDQYFIELKNVFEHTRP